MSSYLPFIIKAILFILIFDAGLFAYTKVAATFNQPIAGIPNPLSRINQPSGTSSASVSPDILFVTFPANSFSGIVEKIDGNTLTVTHEVKIPVPSGTQPKTEKLTYTIKLAQNATIARFYHIPAMYFKPVPTPPPTTNLTIKDIQAGDNINAITISDLRVLQKREFEAQSLVVNSLSALSGKIISVQGSTIKMQLNVGANKEAEILVTKDTEISSVANPTTQNPNPTPKEHALADLKKDMRIMVYPVIGQPSGIQIKALRIEPIN